MCERACVCEESQDGQRWVVVVVVMVLQCMKISMEKLGRVIEEEDSKMDRLAEVRGGEEEEAVVGLLVVGGKELARCR